MSDEADFLRAQRRRINRRICGIEGHDWKDVEIKTNSTYNVSDLKVCKRCGDRKAVGVFGDGTNTTNLNLNRDWPDELRTLSLSGE